MLFIFRTHDCTRLIRVCSIQSIAAETLSATDTCICAAALSLSVCLASKMQMQFKAYIYIPLVISPFQLNLLYVEAKAFVKQVVPNVVWVIIYAFNLLWELATHLSNWPVLSDTDAHYHSNKSVPRSE
jgi:hypothetical protein